MRVTAPKVTSRSGAEAMADRALVILSTKTYGASARIPRCCGRKLVQIARHDGARCSTRAGHEGRERFPLSANVGDRYPASVTAVGTALLAELTRPKSRSSIGIPASWSASPNDQRPHSPRCMNRPGSVGGSGYWIPIRGWSVRCAS
jgi:hypothetical protein